MKSKVNGGALLRQLCNAYSIAHDKEAFRDLMGNVARYQIGWQRPSDARRHLDDRG